MNYENMTTDEIGGIFSDWYKDTHGFRPRHVSYSDREGLINGCNELAAYHDKMQQTFEGREELRENGWIIQETDPQLKKQAYWLATERDNWKRKEYGDDWVESLAEARHYLPQEAA
jgi:hypothetical protein